MHHETGRNPSMTELLCSRSSSIDTRIRRVAPGLAVLIDRLGSGVCCASALISSCVLCTLGSQLFVLCNLGSQLFVQLIELLLVYFLSPCHFCLRLFLDRFFISICTFKLLLEISQPGLQLSVFSFGVRVASRREDGVGDGRLRWRSRWRWHAPHF